MALSGTYTFTRNRDQLINVAFDILGLKSEGRALTSQQVTDAAVLLNMMIKTMPAGGINLWRYEDLTVFLTEGVAKYTIGPSGDHAATTYADTTIATAGVATDGTITVASTTGFSNGDNIGIVLDDNTIQWTTINGAPTSTVITLTTPLTGASAVGNKVFGYTSKPQRPMKIQSGRWEQKSGNEYQMNLISRDDYFGLSVKDSQGNPSSFYYNPTLTNGELYLWVTPSDVNATAHFVMLRQLQDVTEGTDNLEFPQEWELPLAYALADLLLTSYGDAISPQKVALIQNKAASLMEIVEGYDQENASIRFQPYENTYS